MAHSQAAQSGPPRRVCQGTHRGKVQPTDEVQTLDALGEWTALQVGGNRGLIAGRGEGKVAQEWVLLEQPLGDGFVPGGWECYRLQEPATEGPPVLELVPEWPEPFVLVGGEQLELSSPQPTN